MNTKKMTKIFKIIRRHVKRFLFVNAFIIGGYSSFSQTTDRIKYYIAFDQSGSVAINDKFKYFNQQELLKQFVEITDQQTISEVEFKLYPFGEDTVQRNVLTNSSSMVLTYAEVEANTKHVISNKFTHIDAAVNKILLDIQNEEDRPSSGVFIFTDGRLEDGDFIKQKRIQTIEQYIRGVNDTIKIIKEKYHVPVYIILVSHENRQPYYDASSVFWHNNSLKVNEQDIGNLYKFVNEANLEISSPRFTPAVENKEKPSVLSEEKLTETAVYIQSAGVLSDTNAVGVPPSISWPSDKGIEKILNQLNTILQKDEFSKMDIDDIYTYLIKLTDDSSFKARIEDQSKQKALTPDIFKEKTEDASLDKAVETEGYSLEEKIILGFSDYIINRAKQEAVISFVEFINNYDFGKDTTLIKRQLFSNFFSLLKYDNSIYDVVMIRNALLKDIQELPRNLISTKCRFDSDGIVALYAFTILYENIIFNGSLEKSFDELYKAFLTPKVAVEMHNNQTFVLIKFTAKLIGCLERYNFDKVYLKDPKKLSKLSKMLIALALRNAIGKQTIDVSNAEEMIVNVYRQYQTIKRQIEYLNVDLQINEKAGNLKELREYRQEIVDDIIKKSAELLFAGAIILERTTKIDAENYIRDAKQGVEIWFAVREQRYSDAAFLAAPSILEIVSKSGNDSTKMLNTLQTLVFVAGEISDAKNPDDIQKIIAKHTLPVASYKVKRKYVSSFMLTAYPGFGGTAYLKGDSTDYALSITAPVGVEFTRGGFSFMFPLFDIGNIIDYRFNNKEDDKEAVSFERIISPGFIVSYGLSYKFPVSLTAGYQFNPERITIALALDLPLLGFWKNIEKRKGRNK